MYMTHTLLILLLRSTKVQVFHSIDVAYLFDEKHAMMCHCSQFLQLHGALLQFTQQGLEKYNDRLTKIFFRTVSLCIDCGIEIKWHNFLKDAPSSASFRLLNLV